MYGHFIRPIGYVRSDYNEKFGIPRQPGLVKGLEQAVVIEPEFSNTDAVRGLEGFSHIWIIWGFSANTIDMTRDPVKWRPTVRPPRLGGSTRKGVWASRSPYRPNSLGLSSVRLERIEVGGRPLDGAQFTGMTTEELTLIISGADIMNGTPVYDIKPYIPYSDCHPDASGGFAVDTEWKTLTVDFPGSLLERIEPGKRDALISILELDPRGAYERKPGYAYGMSFGAYDVKFTVSGTTLTVTDVAEVK